MNRTAEKSRKTKETEIHIRLNLDGAGKCEIDTGIAFFDHMLTLFSVHGFFDLNLSAKGDLAVDFHHTVEDVGLLLGECIAEAVGNRKGITRYGHAVTPMDETLTSVAIDLSNRPFLVYNAPREIASRGDFDAELAGEFLRALSVKAGMTLHVNVHYGRNEHHIIESIFKSLGRALNQATGMDPRVEGFRTSKGSF